MCYECIVVVVPISPDRNIIVIRLCHCASWKCISLRELTLYSTSGMLVGVILLLSSCLQLSVSINRVYSLTSKRFASSDLQCYSTEISGSVQCSEGQRCGTWLGNATIPTSKCVDAGKSTVFRLNDAQQSWNTRLKSSFRRTSKRCYCSKFLCGTLNFGHYGPQ